MFMTNPSQLTRRSPRSSSSSRYHEVNKKEVSRTSQLRLPKESSAGFTRHTPESRLLGWSRSVRVLEGHSSLSLVSVLELVSVSKNVSMAHPVSSLVNAAPTPCPIEGLALNG